MTNARSSRPVPVLWSLGLAMVLGLATLVLPAPAFGQVANASLSGTVYDTSGAVIPGATVALTNQATNVTNKTTANGVGFFSFPLLQPGTYNVTISSTGFTSWEQKDVVLEGNESRTLPNIALKVGGATTTVDVVSAATAVAPVDTGENRTTLNQNMVTNIGIEGRDAAELIKLMPGMGLNTGLSQSPWNSLTTQTNSGPVGQYSANGTQPYGGMQLTIDGGVITDTGNMGTQTANINQDQTAEFTVHSSAFDAEYSHGPVVAQATSKSGGSTFHGDAYVYGRNGSLNAEDSYFKAEHLTKPIDHYWYPGADVGGPVIIPGTDFNKNRDKLFFYGAFEYMDQHPEGGLINVFTYDNNMLQGNFGPGELAPEANTGWQTSVVPCAASNSGQWWFPNYCGAATGANNTIVNGQIPTALFDPNGLAYAKLFPGPNVDPTTHQGYNYQKLLAPPVNRYEMRLRGDYNVTANTRAYVSYDRQHEIDQNYLGVWWEPAGTVPYPSSFPAIEISDLWSASVTHVFNPSLTNETTFNFTSFINPLKFANPSAADPSKLGLNIPLPYNAGTAPMIPNTFSYGTWGPGAMPMFFAPAFSGLWDNGAFGALKRVPNLSDNLAWIKGTHTIKIGASWERMGNQQTEGVWGSNEGFPQGSFEWENYAHYTTSNEMADLLLGNANTFNQTSLDAVHTLWFTELGLYVQDHWKASRRLTIDAGLRLDHEGQWFPSGSTPGEMVFDPNVAACQQTKGPKCAGPDLPGFTWNAIDKSIPISGFKSVALYPDPHAGASYDLFGNGKTVLRGAFGMYRYQLAYNDVAGALDGPLGIQGFTTNCNIHGWAFATTNAACVGNITPNGALPPASNNLGESALEMNDNRTPYTQNWNFSVDQRGPWNSTIEVGYNGSRSRNELIAAGLANVNITAPQAYFNPDPVNGNLYCGGAFITQKAYPNCVPGGIPSGNSPDYLPYNYGGIGVNSHGSYSNYNALQMKWEKQAGRSTFMTNYTWSKVLGIRDGQTDNGNGNGSLLNPYNIKSNYGVLAFDHTQIFNAAYVLNLPGLHSGNRLAKGIVNGWILSGITQFQSGAPIQPNTGGTLDASYTGNFSGEWMLGNNAMTLTPLLTCDPRKGLTSGQHFNPNCFTLPQTMGQNGDLIWPYIKGPGYFDSDLGMYKDFHITERQKLEFRVQAFNFLNHPLPDFTLNSTDENLSFVCNSSPACVHTPLDSGASLANTNIYTTGKPLYTIGRRVMELSIKYSF